MPLPPRDFSDFHSDVGIRREITLLTPMAKFAPPYALLMLQRMRDAGNPLILLLDDLSWMCLACVDEMGAAHAIQYAMPYAMTANRKLINSTLYAAAAPFLGPMLVVSPPPPPPPPPRAPKFAPARAAPTPPPSSASATPSTPTATATALRIGSMALRNAICDAIRFSGGSVTKDTFRPFALRLDGLGPQLAAKAVREFMYTDGWQQAPDETLGGVISKYV